MANNNNNNTAKPKLAIKPRGRGRGGGGGGGRGSCGTETESGGRQGGEGGGGGGGRGGDVLRDARGVKGQKRGKWSQDTVPLPNAIRRAPVVIRLEEGHRGPQEELSLSAGDTLALEGVTLQKEKGGRRVVMAYYVDDINLDDEYSKEEKEDGAVPYIALVLLPCDSLPSLEVRVWEEEERGPHASGHSRPTCFARLVDTHFSTCNWTRHRQTLLDKMGDSNYIDASSIRAITQSHQAPDKEEWSPQKTHHRPPPPRPPPKPAPPLRVAAATPITTPSSPTLVVSGSTGGEGEGESPPPPPRPPRSTQPAPHHTEKEAPDPAPSPPSLSHRPPPRPPKRSEEEEEEKKKKKEEEGEAEVFAMPSLAELFSAGAFSVDSEEAETVSHTKDKKKEWALMKAAKTLGKKLYGGMTTTHKQSSSSTSSQDGRGADTAITSSISIAPSSVGDDTDDLSDADNDDYTEIDEINMDPAYDKPPPPQQASKTKQDKKGKANKSKAAKPPKAAIVRPIQRVPPQNTGDLSRTSEPTSPTSRPPTSSASRPLVAGRVPYHPMMAPGGAYPDIYEVEDEAASPKSVTSPLQEMSCNQLCFRLRQCGMPGLAQICQNESLDGAFLCTLTDDALKDPPFSLHSFDVDTKLTMVKAGWVPK